MNIGAEIPFRRSRRAQSATGSLIFDREREDHARKHGESKGEEMRIWVNGHFSKP